jgi:predicted phosphodiesterase
MLDVIEPPVLAQLVGAPTETSLEFENLRIAVYHGSPWDSEGEYVYPDFPEWQKFGHVAADLVILGHTHIPFVRKVENTLVVNPGSCGQPRDGDPRAAYAVFDTATREVQLKRIEYDLEKVCREIRDLNFDPVLQRVLRTGSTRG